MMQFAISMIVIGVAALVFLIVVERASASDSHDQHTDDRPTP